MLMCVIVLTFGASWGSRDIQPDDDATARMAKLREHTATLELQHPIPQGFGVASTMKRDNPIKDAPHVPGPAIPELFRQQQSIPANQGLLSGLPDHLFASLFSRATTVRLKANAVLFLAGDTGDGCYRVEDGLLKVTMVSRADTEWILAFLGPRAIVGEMSIIDGLPRSASVVAVRAAMAGIARENVSRILNDWKRRRLVSRLSGYYCIENKVQLQNEAEL
jgi:Cyclic nucleotide-binding domain